MDRIVLGLLMSLLLGRSTLAEVHRTNLFPPRVFATGHRPTGVAIADFDRDGHLDLAVSNYESPVTLSFGIGDGSFVPVSRLSTNILSTGILAVDLDGDGWQELVINQGAWLVVLPNDGNGAFAEGNQYWKSSSGDSFEALAVADVDNDSQSDVIVGGSPIVVYLGAGDGSLLWPPTVLADDGVFFVVPGDFNEDGLVDFASSSGFAGTVKVWLGNGDGTFLDPVATEAAGYDAVAHDFNLDGHLDLAVVYSPSSEVSVLLGTGDGGFKAALSYNVDQARHIALADLNRDTRVDLVVSTMAITSRPEINVLLSTGIGSFAPPVAYSAPALGGDTGVGDFDEDGVDDIAVVSYSGSLGDTSLNRQDKGGGALAPFSGIGYRLAGNRSGGLVSGRPTFFGSGMDDVRDIVVVDLDDDGVADLATANAGADELSIAIGQGDGTFLQLGPVTTGNAPVSLAAGHFDAGPTADLVVANQESSDLSVLLGDGEGVFESRPAVPLGRSAHLVVVGDLNDDGVDDLVTANPDTSDISIVAGHGDGTFDTPVTISVREGIYGAQAVVITDLDADEVPDLAVANVFDVSIFLGRGDGTFAEEYLYTPGTTAIQALAAADLDEDGDQDLVLAGRGDPPLVVLYGDGAGGIEQRVSIEVAGAVYDVAIADFDGNGRQDVAVAHLEPMISVILGVDGGFMPRLEFAAGAGSRLAAGEFNLDGRVDLAVTATDAVAALLNQAPVLIGWSTDKQTLSWPILVGYDGFNVYRGDLMDLRDADLDGLADGGYGQCRNAEDNDTTDTKFIDPEVPASEGGFFYLMSRMRGGSETELGTTSSGLPRTPATPCVVGE